MKTSDPIDPRDQRIAELEAENAELRARLDKLERFLGLNSSNSSLAPSSDSEKDKKKRKRKLKSQRKQGGQPGHKGTKREMLPEDEVDFFAHHYPTQCDCGLELEQDHATQVFERVQVFELVPKLVECTEHRLHTCQCPGCGAHTRATLSQSERLGWGPRLSALCATLSVVLNVTRRKVDYLFGQVLQVPSSLGSVQTYLEESSDALAPGCVQARAHVMAAEVIGCDETGWRLGRLPHWIWLAQSKDAVVVQIQERRTKAAAKTILEDAKARVIVTDRYGSYNWLEQTRNQVCRAHLLRDWEQIAQRKGALGAIGKRLVKQEKSLHKAWRQWQQGQMTRQTFVEECAKVRESMEQEWHQAKQCTKTPGVINWVTDPKNTKRCWVFMEHEDVELTNNQAERDVRMCVIQRKLSFGSQSERGLSLMGRLWTVALTCKRQGTSILDYITQSIASFRLGQHPPQLV